MKLFFLISLFPVGLLIATPGDFVADRVLGQASFAAAAVTQPADDSLGEARDVAVDANTGWVWVADTPRHRVLGYDRAASLANREPASIVIGQNDPKTGDLQPVSARTLRSPTGLAVDLAGNLYIADTGNNRVLFFEFPQRNNDAAEWVLGQPDFTSAVANNDATNLAVPGRGWMNGPAGLHVNFNGVLRVADRNNHRILVFSRHYYSRTREASAVVGQPDFAAITANTGGANTGLSSPSDVVALTSEIELLFIADTGNNRVQRISNPAAPATHLAYGQPNQTTVTEGTSDRKMRQPQSVALDSAGNLYVSDTGNHRVLVFSFESDVVADGVWGQKDFTSGSANDGGISALTLNQPSGLITDGGGRFVFLADAGNRRVLRMDQPLSYGTPVGIVFLPSTVSASSGAAAVRLSFQGVNSATVARVNGATRSLQFHEPFLSSLTLQPADTGPGVTSVPVSFSNPGSGGGTLTFDIPVTPATSNDNAADSVLGQGGLSQSSRNVAGIAVARFAGVSASGLNLPEAICVSQRTGRVYVADAGNHRILSWSGERAFAMGAAADFQLGQRVMFEAFANADTQLSLTSFTGLNAPEGLCLDLEDNLWVADTGNGRVLRFDRVAAGTTARLASVILDGTSASQSLFGTPRAVAVDIVGRLYVADQAQKVVLTFAPPFVSHQDPIDIFGNGFPETDKWIAPRGIAVDANFHIFVSDGFGGNRILMFQRGAGGVRFLRAFYGQVNGTDRIANAPTGVTNDFGLENPGHLAVTADGWLLCCDEGNNRVVAFRPRFTIPNANRSIMPLVLGQVTTTTDVFPSVSTASNLRIPSGVAVMFDGNVLVTDQDAHRALKFQHPWGDRYSVSPWRALHFTPEERRDPAISGHGADPDRDGRGNAAEYAMGTNPRIVDALGAAHHLAPAYATSPGRFALTFPIEASLNDVTYWTQWSDDLVTWDFGIGSRNFTGEGLRTDEFHELEFGLVPASQLIQTDITGLPSPYARRTITINSGERPRRFARLMLHGGP
jgi:sugar lactone lactonase YvrE